MKTLRCLQCDKEFKTFLSEIKVGKGKFCSRECFNMSRITSVKKECLVCQKEFLIYKSTFEKRGAKYCSQQCYLLTRERSYLKKCLTCQKEFKTKPYRIKNGGGKYCSRICFFNNNIPWNKGKKLSPMPVKIREKISQSLSGPGSRYWQGGITDLNHQIRGHFLYKEWKISCFERDNYTCQICGQYNGKLQVDHIQSWAEYVELRFNINNCRTLCMDCHYLITFGKPKPEGLIWGHNLKYKEGNRWL